MSRKRTSLKMSREELLKEVKRLEFTVKSRGIRIGGLYCVIERLMSASAEARKVSMEVSLQEQLTIARLAIAPNASSTNHSLQYMDCIICYENFSETHQAVALNCGHIYGEACIVAHQAGKQTANCPVCRRAFQSFLPLFL